MNSSNFENMNTRGALAIVRARYIARSAREARATWNRADDRATRERLERSASGGARLSFVDLLNGMSHDRAAAEQPGFQAIEAVRKAQQLAGRSAAHNASHDRLDEGGQRGGLWVTKPISKPDARQLEFRD